MPKKDVCYVTTAILEPVYLKGQIVSIKEPNSEWSDIERGIKIPEGSDMRLAVQTIMVAKTKLEIPASQKKRLIVVKKNNRNYVDAIPKYVPPEIY